MRQSFLPRIFMVIGILASLPAQPSGAASPRSLSEPRLIVIGLDGADLITVDRLIKEGRRLPNFRRLLAEGWAAPVRAFDPVLSPPLWTTIATGRFPSDHGIWDFLEVSPAGHSIPVTSNSRLVRAFWNIAAENDVSSAVLGWYATWPAEKIRGAIVSDRFVAHQMGGEVAAPRTALTFPTDLAGTLEPLRPDATESLEAVGKRFIRGQVPAGSKDRVDSLAKSWASSESIRRSFPVVMDRFHPQLAALYFDLPDAAGHLFADAASPKLPEVSAADFQAFDDVWARVYEYVDELVGRILDRAGSNTTVMICSDHGFKDAEDRPRRSGRVGGGPAGLWHRRNGLLVLHGPNIRRGQRLARPVELVDLFPTLAATAGLPISKELPGQVLEEAFNSPLTVRRVASYETSRRKPPPLPADADAGASESVKRLKALGYLGGGGTESSAHKGGRSARSFVNEGVFYMGRGELTTGVERLENALALDPDLPDARLTLVSVLGSLGELDRAEKELDRIPEGREQLGVLLSRAGLAIERGRALDAEGLIDRAARIDDRDAGLWLLRARTALALGRPSEALDWCARVIPAADEAADTALAKQVRANALDALGRRKEAIAEMEEQLSREPSSPAAMTLGRLFAKDEKADLALAAFARAARLDPASPWPILEEAKVFLSSGRFGDARTSYTRALEKTRAGRGRELARLGLALSLLSSGQEPEARKQLKAGIQENPGSSALRIEFGLMLARSGERAEALEQLREAVRLSPGSKSLTPFALVLAASGKIEEAIAAARRSLESEPNQPDVVELIRRLSSSQSH